MTTEYTSHYVPGLSYIFYVIILHSPSEHLKGKIFRLSIINLVNRYVVQQINMPKS